MNPTTSLKLFCVIFSLLVTLAVVTSAPYSDYDGNVNELFDMLMQRDNVDDNLGVHQVVRKSRGPQLRLRFGKRYEHPYLRLRFGKREDNTNLPVSAYMAGISSEGDN